MVATANTNRSYTHRNNHCFITYLLPLTKKFLKFLKVLSTHTVSLQPKHGDNVITYYQLSKLSCYPILYEHYIFRLNMLHFSAGRIRTKGTLCAWADVVQRYIYTFNLDVEDI